MASTSTAKYRFPQNVDVHEIVTVKLAPSNIFLWKTMMLTLLESHGLVDFVMDVDTAAYQGTTSASTGGDKEKEESWIEIDGLVKRWILATLSEPMLLLMMHLETAKAIWTKICILNDEFVDHVEEDLDKIDLSRYLPLAKAALHNDWEKAAKFLEEEPNAVRTVITSDSETALFLAVRSVKRIRFTRELVAIMTPEDLALLDASGFTALHVAARAGNVMAAKLLVDKNPSLLYVGDPKNLLPLHYAAVGNRKEMFLYLFALTKENSEFYPYHGESGIDLILQLISSGLCDIALMVVQRYPLSEAVDYTVPFSYLIWKCAEFTSEVASFNFWQRIIYSRVPVETRNEENHNSQNGNIPSSLNSAKQKMHGLFWKFTERSVPLVKLIQEKKLMHRQAQQLLEQLVCDTIKFESSKAMEVLLAVIVLAVTVGVHEIVEHILDMYPATLQARTLLEESIFHLAVRHRHENVFNIIYQLGRNQQLFLRTNDRSLNRAFHAAGCLENDQKIKLKASVAGPALQMQRELQWFEEVKKLTPPGLRHYKNSDGKTASVLFAETHQELVKEAETWVKDASSSCTIVAALILTVVFAAAITVPGGNDSSTGLPFHAGKKSFTVFAISNALALFSSTSSLLMFLSILTSQYSEADFLYALPKRLIIGLTTLFVSIIFMMVAFSATVRILFGDLSSLVLVPVITLACVPVTLFMSLQFSLLVDIIKSTYGPGIFGKQSDLIII